MSEHAGKTGQDLIKWFRDNPIDIDAAATIANIYVGRGRCVCVVSAEHKVIHILSDEIRIGPNGEHFSTAPCGWTGVSERSPAPWQYQWDRQGPLGECSWCSKCLAMAQKGYEP